MVSPIGQSILQNIIVNYSVQVTVPDKRNKNIFSLISMDKVSYFSYYRYDLFMKSRAPLMHLAHMGNKANYVTNVTNGEPTIYLWRKILATQTAAKMRSLFSCCVMTIK